MVTPFRSVVLRHPSRVRYPPCTLSEWDEQAFHHLFTAVIVCVSTVNAVPYLLVKLLSLFSLFTVLPMGQSRIRPRLCFQALLAVVTS